MMIASNSPFSMAFTISSAIPAADISGFRSYVGTLGDGTSTRSSPRIRLLDAAIEKIRHVRVFFRLRAAQILEVHLAENLRQDVLDFLRADHEAQPRPRLFILRHGHIAEIFRPRRIGKFVEIRLGQALWWSGARGPRGN